MLNTWSADSELADIVQHFESLVTDEIAAGVVQLHVAVAKLSKLATMAYAEPNLSTTSLPTLTYGGSYGFGKSHGNESNMMGS
jgi:hypothetical protein